MAYFLLDQLLCDGPIAHDTHYCCIMRVFHLMSTDETFRHTRYNITAIIAISH